MKEKEAFTFGLCCLGGLTVNGFTYFKKSTAILPPHFRIAGKKIALVKGFGVHWLKIRKLLQEQLNERDEDDSNGTPNGE